MPDHRVSPSPWSDPLSLHFALKVRGMDFAKVARRVSTEKHPISPSQVRAVVYSCSSTDRDLIMGEIRKILRAKPGRSFPRSLAR
jgi:hypothetical protein